MSRALFLDGCIAATVIALTMGVLLRESMVCVDKARLIEVFSHAGVGRIELMERLAQYGADPQQMPPALRLQEPAPARDGRVVVQSARVVDSHYVLAGQLRHAGSSFSLAFAPSVIEGEPEGSVNWLCGRFGARRGWSGPVAGPGTDLSEVSTPFVCRAQAGSAQMSGAS